jgi:uncharacterized membrane protein
MRPGEQRIRRRCYNEATGEETFRIVSAPAIRFRSFFMAHYRWWVCVVAGTLLFGVLPWHWGAAIRAALAWVVAVAAFLGWTVFDLAEAPSQRLRDLARREDPSRAIILAIALGAAGASLVAVAVLLRKGGGEGPSDATLRIALAGGVVFAAWLLTHAMFAIHYTHSFYGDGAEPGPDDRGGLDFPGPHAHPDFLDFAYFSLVIGMTCQVSDVQITGRHMRRLASLHGILSFFFNTVILAIAVNLVVNAL